MEPEYLTSAQKALPADRAAGGSAAPGESPEVTSPGFSMDTPRIGESNWVFFGRDGLRAGWSVVVFAFLLFFLSPIFGSALSILVYEMAHLTVESGSPLSTIFGEGQWLCSLLGATLLVALIEHRRIADYNLGGPNRLTHFLGGLAAGFVAISTLIGILVRGGWMHLGPGALTGTAVMKYAALWGLAFLLVALFEEGSFRCYLQSTLTRGINFWWALATVGSLCLYLVLASTGHGAWGVYGMALLGLLPCLALYMRNVPGNQFWQAAWVTSTGFGFIHTFNNGENWIGILGAATVGFVFALSVRVTGSAWWAIGCHASWDWAESFFYGTADSGFAAKGHYLTANPAGSVLWSGGSDGPEGSLLVLPVMLLLMLAVILIYGRRTPVVLGEPARERLAS